MKRVLITGAAGFLGSHLCERFLNENFFVIGMDNFITGSLKNIDLFTNHNNFEFIEHDVSKYVQIDGDLDYILHFASPASPIDYLKIPIQTLKVGSLGTHNLLGLAKSKNATILVASTSEVYGDPLVHPQNESYFGNVNPIGPRGVYDEAKRFQEAITMAYHRFHNLNTKIARIFNTYGPRMRLNDGRVLPAFIGQSLRNEDLTIFGDGSQTRSFCYVDDLIEGIYRLLHSDYNYPVNIGNPNEITIKDFANEIVNLTGKNQSIIFKELPENDPLKRKPDIDLAKNILDWKPKIQRSEGLKLTYDYFCSLSDEELNKKDHQNFESYNNILMNYFAHPTAVIDENVKIGDESKIWHFSHIMSNSIIGIGCNIGQNVVVSPYVELGNNVKVQNNVSIYTGVVCEDNVFLGPSMVFTNILNPRSAIIRRDSYIKTLVKKGASIGANATIICGNTIGEYALIGAATVVTKPVKPYALIVGNPGKQIGWVSEYGHRLEFVSGKATCPESLKSYELKNDCVKEIK